MKAARARQAILVGTCVVALISTPPAEADPASSRQTAVLTFTTGEPAAPTGTRLEVRWRNPENPERKPPAVKTMITRFHAGAVIDTTAIGQCRASDLEMLLRGPQACPQDSVLGPGGFVADNGERSVVPRYATFATTMINNRDELITLSEMVDPAFQPPFRMVTRQTARGGAYVTEFPVIPMTADPTDPYTGVASMWARGDPRGDGSRTYLRTPPACPRSGYWTNTMTFIYRDGVEQSVDTSSPCRTAKRQRGRRRARRQKQRRARHSAVSTPRSAQTYRQRP